MDLTKQRPTDRPAARPIEPPAETPEPTDEDLVKRLIAGDQAALSLLYDRYSGTTYRTAYRLLVDPGLSEEIVQETFLTLWDKADVFDPRIASLAAWLATIARNRAIDLLRARGRRVVAVPLSAVFANTEDRPDAADRVLQNSQVLAAGRGSPEPAAAAESAWLSRTLAQAVATLPDPERKVIELAYAGDLTQSEIAAQLGWPIGTVKTRTRRALLALRGALGETLGPETSRQPAT